MLENTDEFYRVFEEEFYASRERIKELRKQYLPLVEVLSKFYKNGNTFDFGCGRGEWLELMQDMNLNPFGVDLNESMLNHCYKNNLNVLKGDALEYLKTLETESQILITSFHVIEHISFENLDKLIKESLRVLKPGGLLILETPNAENLKVSSENFYNDPTHIRPIPSKLLNFMATYHGFLRSTIYRLQEPQGLLDKEYLCLMDVFNGVSPDYAIIAQKKTDESILIEFDKFFNIEKGNSLELLASKFDDNLLFVRKNLEEVKVYQNDLNDKYEKIENNYNAIVNSNSWKLTLPLRLLGKFLRWIYFGSYHWITLSPTSRPIRLLVKLKDKINKNPKLKAKVKHYIRFLPNKILKKITYINNEKEFKIFKLGNKILYFSLSPLNDKRGIGRVTQEQLNYLEENFLSVNEEDFLTEKIYFYSSIHWCPENLPDNSIIMIHDVIPIVLKEYFPIESKIWSDKFKNIAKQAKSIITISETSKKDIIKYLDVEETKINIVYNGVTKIPVADNFKLKLPTDYFVYLGSYDKHKNLDVILEAMSLEKGKNIRLVMIGSNFESKRKVEELKISDRVLFLGRLNDEETGYVIKNSVALLFPSLYEGFGLPPMEAALLNIPAICSTRPTMSEFLFDVVLFADPDNSEGWIDQMNKLIYDKELRISLANNANKRVSEFTWEKSLKNLVEILDKQ